MFKRLVMVAVALALFASAALADANSATPTDQGRGHGRGPLWGGETVQQQLSPADAQRLEQLRQSLAQERDRYRELRRGNAPAAEVNAQREKMEKIRTEAREIVREVCPQGTRIGRGPGMGQAGPRLGRGMGSCGQGMGYRHGRAAAGGGPWMRQQGGPAGPGSGRQANRRAGFGGPRFAAGCPYAPSAAR